MDWFSRYLDHLRHFQRGEYAAAFARFAGECESLFAELTEEKLREETERFLAFAAGELKPRLGRRAKCFDLRCFLCVYLCPAALAYGTETARRFAAEMNEAWNRAYPEFTFEPGSFEDIASGFRAKPFSF